MTARWFKDDDDMDACDVTVDGRSYTVIMNNRIARLVGSSHVLRSRDVPDGAYTQAVVLVWVEGMVRRQTLDQVLASEAFKDALKPPTP